MDEMRRYGRKPKEGELINQKLQVWLTRSLRDQLERERQEAGVQSLGAFVRMKLGAIAGRGQLAAARKREADEARARLEKSRQTSAEREAASHE